MLYTLTEPPVPCLQDAVLRHPGAFRYYRFIAPPAFPQANLAMLEFLTRRDRGYTNVAEPGPAAVLSPDDTLAAKGEKWVKLLDAPSWEEMKWKPEYDGNMLTAPGAFYDYVEIGTTAGGGTDPFCSRKMPITVSGGEIYTNCLVGENKVGIVTAKGLNMNFAL